MANMVVKEFMETQYEFHAVKEKNFTDDKGNTVNYFVVLAYPIKENGEADDEQVTFGVKSDCVSKLKELNKGDIVVFEMEVFGKAKVSDVQSI